jgi:arsenate reductase
MSAVIYHNPRCSKSRETLKLLQQNYAGPIQVVHYLEHPPTPQELKQLCGLLGIAPANLIRSGESLFKELDLSLSDNRSDDEWLEILSNHPKLIERPIVSLDNSRAAIGRPPEKVLTLLNNDSV